MGGGSKPFLFRFVGVSSIIHKFTHKGSILLEGTTQFLEFEDRFRELRVEDAFRWLESQEQPEVWGKLRALDWGPTTDDYICFLLPIRKRLYLACRENGSGSIHAVKILPYDLITVLSAALAELSKFNPQASPEIV